MLEHFLKSQSEINAKTCNRYASQQYAAMTRSKLYNEDSNQIMAISGFIVKDAMIDMTNTIFGVVNQSGKIT